MITVKKLFKITATPSNVEVVDKLSSMKLVLTEENKTQVGDLSVNLVKMINEFNSIIDIILKDIAGLTDINKYLSLRYFFDKYNFTESYTSLLSLPTELFKVVGRTFKRVEYKNTQLFKTFIDELDEELNKKIIESLPELPNNIYRKGVFESDDRTVLQMKPGEFYDYMVDNLIRLIKMSVYTLFWCIRRLEELPDGVDVIIIDNIKEIIVKNYFDTLVYKSDGSINQKETISTQPPRITVIKTIDGKNKSFFPIGKKKIGDNSYVDGIFNILISNKGWKRFNDIFFRESAAATRFGKGSPINKYKYNSDTNFIFTKYYPNSLTFQRGGEPTFNSHPELLKFSLYFNSEIPYEPHTYSGQNKKIIDIDTIYGNLGKTFYVYLSKTVSDVDITLLALYLMISMKHDEALNEMPYYTNYSDETINPQNVLDPEQLKTTFNSLLESYIEYEKYECYELLSNNYHILYELFGKEIYDVLKKIFDYIYIKKQLTGYNIFRILRCATFYRYYKGTPPLDKMHSVNNFEDYIQDKYDNKFDVNKLQKGDYKNLLEKLDPDNDLIKKMKDDKVKKMIEFYIDKLNTYVFENISVSRSIMDEFKNIKSQPSSTSSMDKFKSINTINTHKVAIRTQGAIVSETPNKFGLRTTRKGWSFKNYHKVA